MVVIGGNLMVVAVMVVMPYVEVEMKETGINFSVAMPVASCMETEPGHTDHRDQEETWTRRAEASNGNAADLVQCGASLPVERLGDGFKRTDIGLHHRHEIPNLGGVAAWVEEQAADAKLVEACDGVLERLAFPQHPFCRLRG